MEPRESGDGQSEKNAIRIVQCPICERKYRFDLAKMTKEKVSVRCRKCENIFAISKDMFLSAGMDTSPSPSPREPSSPATEDSHPITFVIKDVPNETARLRIATRLIPLTRENLSLLIKRLSKTPASFLLEMTQTEADKLLQAIESTGAKAEYSSTDVPLVSKKRGAGDFPKKGWKKWAIAAVLVFLLVGGGGLSYHMYREVQKTHVLEQRGIDSVIPTGAFLYVRLKDIEKNWTKIQANADNSRLGVLFKNLKSTPQVQDLLSRKREWESRMGVPFLGPDLMDFIGVDVRLAMYADSSSKIPDLVLTLKGNFKTKLVETLVNWIPEPFKGSLPRRIDRERRVYAFQPQGLRREVYFFSEGMVYVVSTSPDLIRTSKSLVRRKASAKKSLTSLSLASKKGRRHGFNEVGSFYIGVRELVRSRFRKKQSGGSEPFSSNLEGYGDLVGTISYGKGLVVESTMAVDVQTLDQPLRGLVECAPATNKTLAYLPKSTIIYASNNCFELGTYFSWLRENLKERRDFHIGLNKVIHGINAQTGVDIEKEFLPFLGRGFSYAVVDASRDGKVRFPGVHLFFQTSNRSRVEASIRGFLEKSTTQTWFTEAGVDLVTVQHENVPITYLRYRGTDMRFFFLSAVTPCYAFMDEMLVIGSDVEGLRQMVDLSKGRGLSILKDRRFKEMSRLVGEKNSGMTYVDLKAVSRLLKGFTTQGGLGEFSKVGANKEQDLRVLFQILEALNFIGSSAEFEGDHVRFLFYVAL